MDRQTPPKAHRTLSVGTHTGAQPPRMRPALRTAVDEIILNGRTITKAAEIAGMNMQALSRALLRPAIAAYLEAAKSAACIEAGQLKEHAKAIAIREGIRLMTDAASEQVRARMVEFFAREGAQPLVNVNINGGPAPYNLTRPSTTIDHQKRVQPDVQSGDDISQAIDITPQSDD